MLLLLPLLVPLILVSLLPLTSLSSSQRIASSSLFQQRSTAGAMSPVVRSTQAPAHVEHRQQPAAQGRRGRGGGGGGGGPPVEAYDGRGRQGAKHLLPAGRATRGAAPTTRRRTRCSARVSRGKNMRSSLRRNAATRRRRRRRRRDPPAAFTAPSLWSLPGCGDRTTWCRSHENVDDEEEATVIAQTLMLVAADPRGPTPATASVPKTSPARALSSSESLLLLLLLLL